MNIHDNKKEELTAHYNHMFIFGKNEDPLLFF